MTYKISPDKYDDFAKRNALKILLLFVGMFTTLILIIGVAVGDSVIFQKVFIGKSGWLILILAYIGGMRWYQERNLAKSLIYLISPDSVAKMMDKNQLNIGNQIGVRKGERYGSKTNQIIYNHTINEIAFEKNGIKITSSVYNWFTGNGKIFIPKEIENYEKLVSHFKVLKQKNHRIK